MKVSSRRKSPVPVIGAKIGDVPVYDRRGNLVDSGRSMSDLQSPLPEVTGADNGKVLGVVSGEWQAKDIREVPSGGNTSQVLTKNSNGYGWASIPSEIPQYDQEPDGSVLSVDNQGRDLVWSQIPKELPTYSSSEAGKILEVDSDGDLNWSTLPASRTLYNHSITISVNDPNSPGTMVAEYGFNLILPVNTSLVDTDLNLLKTALKTYYADGTKFPLSGIRSATPESFRLIISQTGFDIHAYSYASGHVGSVIVLNESSEHCFVGDIITQL